MVVCKHVIVMFLDVMFFIFIPPSIFSVAGGFNISMFVEYHDLVDVIPLHPLVTHVLGLSELLTFGVQGLEMT